MGKHSQTARMSTGGGAPLKKIIKKPLKPLVVPPRPKMRPPPNMKLLHYGRSLPLTSAQKISLHSVYMRAERCEKNGGTPKQVQKVLDTAYLKAGIVLPAAPLLKGGQRWLQLVLFPSH